MYTLLYIKQIINKDFNCIAQGTLYLVFCNNLCGKRIWKRMDICTAAAAAKSLQLCPTL